MRSLASRTMDWCCRSEAPMKSALPATWNQSSWERRVPVPKKNSTNINTTQQNQWIVDKDRTDFSLTFSQTVRAEHCQPQYDVITQTEHILHQMYGSIREDADTQALLQPPEGVDAEQQLHQQGWQLWDYRQYEYQNQRGKTSFNTAMDRQPTLTASARYTCQNV